MAHIDASLAWAIPVQVDVLGAHLEAYCNVLPTLSALRLCHRFGIGSSLSRLPAELVLCIEDYLTSEEREERIFAWKEDFRCFRQECDEFSHFENEELDEFRDLLRCGGSPPSGIIHEDDEISDDELIEYLYSSELLFDVHNDRRDSWKARVDRAPDAHPVSLHNKQKLLLDHFGLAVWTAHHRVGSEGGFDPYYPSETTLSYLILPNASTGSHDGSLSTSEAEGEFPLLFETSCAVGVQPCLSLPSNAVARFKRAMRILGLEPYKNEWQRGCGLAPDPSTGIQTGEKEKPCNNWPQLTMLVTVVHDEL